MTRARYTQVEAVLQAAAADPRVSIFRRGRTATVVVGSSSLRVSLDTPGDRRSCAILRAELRRFGVNLPRHQTQR